jgi:uncharacterized protein YegP (UPF0339 family)
MKQIIIFQGVNNQYYFRVTGWNNKTIAQSEGYKTLRGAIKTAKLFRTPIVIK